MSVTVTWNTGPLDRAKERWARQGLTAAAGHFRKALRERISIQGRPTSRRSLPGEAPRRETGAYIASWQYVVSSPPAYAEIYSNLPRAYTLEMGGPGTWGFVSPRPHIRRTLLAEEATLVLLLTPMMP